MTELRYDGRVAIVTGGGRGVGRSHALLLASKGARVVVADYGVGIDGDGSSAEPATEVVAEIKAAGGEAVACFASVADERRRRRDRSGLAGHQPDPVDRGGQRRKPRHDHGSQHRAGLGSRFRPTRTGGQTMTQIRSGFEEVDFFTDESLVPDPYPYFDHLRSKCPVAHATPVQRAGRHRLRRGAGRL